MSNRAVKYPDARFSGRVGRFCKAALVNFYLVQPAGSSPRCTQTRRVCSKFPNSRGNCPEPSRATFRGRLERAGCFSEVHS